MILRLTTANENWRARLKSCREKDAPSRVAPEGYRACPQGLEPSLRPSPDGTTDVVPSRAHQSPHENEENYYLA